MTERRPALRHIRKMYIVDHFGWQIIKGVNSIQQSGSRIRSPGPAQFFPDAYAAASASGSAIADSRR